MRQLFGQGHPPSGIPTTSYLSKAARMARIAGSGLGSEPFGFASCCVWAWLSGGITAIRYSNMAQHERMIRKSWAFEPQLGKCSRFVEFSIGSAPVLSSENLWN